MGAASAEVKIDVEGMMCDGCSSRIQEVLKGMDIVEDVSVSLEKKCANVHVVAPVSEALPVLVAAIQDLGFEAKPAQ